MKWKEKKRTIPLLEVTQWAEPFQIGLKCKKKREKRETNAVWNHEIEKHGKGSKREGISIQPKIRNE